MKLEFTTNTSDQYSPVIYGNKIAWEDDRNGNCDIYIYDLSTKKQIHTTNTSHQSSPDIYGNRIVWIDDRNGNELGNTISTCTISPLQSKLRSPPTDQSVQILQSPVTR